MDYEPFRRCEHCASLYDWRKSSSRWLKMTVCSFSCERALLQGQTIESLLTATHLRRVHNWSDDLMVAIREAAG